MSKNTIQLVQGIVDYTKQNTEQSVSPSDIKWILERWPAAQSIEREITLEQLHSIRDLIQIVPTGKQRHYRQALAYVIEYLKDVCLWTLPEKEEKRFQDHDLIWMSRIAEHTYHSAILYENYCQQRSEFLLLRHTLSPLFMSLLIGFEIAPLPIRHILRILTTPSIDNSDEYPRLKVEHHSKKSDDDPYFTHYHLPLFCYRVLSDFYQQDTPPLTEKLLITELSEWAHKLNITINSAYLWQQCFQAHWFTFHKLPATLLKDLSIPERHVGYIPHRNHLSTKMEELYAIDWDTSWFNRCSDTKKQQWPHKKLLKTRIVDMGVAPEWEEHNVLPKILFHYTADLILNGGIKKSSLSTNTIKKYVGIESHLEHYPLSYEAALDAIRLNQWAHDMYASVPDGNVKLVIRYFLRFVSIQTLTEQLDISAFSALTTKPSVNAHRITLAEFDQLIETLIINTTTNPFRSLCACMAAILGFFGVLRRGEVIRLRNKDIEFDPTTGKLTLHIENTEEGDTKGKKQRTVHTVVPNTDYIKLIKAAMIIKRDAPADSLFIGFFDESEYSRQLNYIKPVTRALKHLFTDSTTFHHLRHSGVHLLFTQGFHLFSDSMNVEPSSNESSTDAYQESVLMNRFDYWLEGRTPNRVNDAFLIDEMCRQIGHENYATTRWSYLHGIDWLLPIILPAFSQHKKRAYSHSHLRYLFGLSPQSNDLSRRLNALSSDYALKFLSEKQTQFIELSEHELRNALFPQQALKNRSPTYLFKRWQQSIISQEDVGLIFVFKQMLINKKIDWTGLSYMWRYGSQHDIGPMTKKQKTALNNLPSLSVQENRLSLTMACNVKNSRLFNTVFRDKTWSWLAFHFELSSNRKLRNDRVVDLLHKHYVQKKDTFNLSQHPKGQTRLTITMAPKHPVSIEFIHYIHLFLSSFQTPDKEIL